MDLSEGIFSRGDEFNFSVIGENLVIDVTEITDAGSSSVERYYPESKK